MRAAPYTHFSADPPSIPAEQWAFLAQRFRKAVSLQPEIALLRRRLRSMGGYMLVPAPGDIDKGITTLLREGQVMSGPVTFRKMEASHCYSNVARAWLERTFQLAGMCTGYALSHDGLWRKHGWGLRSDGGILETTALREMYFGITFPAEMGDEVANRILAKRNSH